jgi:hypothetical protein
VSAVVETNSGTGSETVNLSNVPGSISGVWQAGIQIPVGVSGGVGFSLIVGDCPAGRTAHDLGALKRCQRASKPYSWRISPPKRLRAAS